MSGNPNSSGMESSAPWLPGRLRACLAFWLVIGASNLVLSWIDTGFLPEFSHFPRPYSLKNQDSCYEPPEQFAFVDLSVRKLLGKGVIAPWGSVWGPPKAVSPLKVVPKKGKDLFRLILDLSRLNKHLVFPKFKYASIQQAKDVFNQGDLLFSWDLKDGYWHVALHPDFWTYCCFEWEGQLYYWAQMPFGLAPACWVFTVLIGTVISYLRKQGLRCLAYIDDGLAGGQPMSEAVRLAALVSDSFTQAGFILNVAKSDFVPKAMQVFIGYRVDCSSTSGAGKIGWLAPSESRLDRLVAQALKVLKAKLVSPQEILRLAGFIVSLRPVFDPMALLFTKFLYIWAQSRAELKGWHWHWKLEDGEARSEVQVWVDFAVAWSVKPLWQLSPPDLVQAQDASDSAVGGWLGPYCGVSEVWLEKVKSGDPDQKARVAAELPQNAPAWWGHAVWGCYLLDFC